MGADAINKIVSLLPEKLIYDAACRHIVKLSLAGRLEEAENLYDMLYGIDASLESLAEAAGSLVGRHIARHEIDKALSIYNRFPWDATNCDMLAEKLKTCHLLVFALMPGHLKKAHELWQECGQYDLNSFHKWQWTGTGLALLECCYKNSHSEMAEEIYKAMKRYEGCETGKAFMKKAEQLMNKIGR